MHLISPNTITPKSNLKVMRIKEMIMRSLKKLILPVSTLGKV